MADTIFAARADHITSNFIIDYGDSHIDNVGEGQLPEGRAKLKYLTENTDEVIMAVQHVTENKNATPFNFIYDEEVYTYQFDKEKQRASIFKNIYFGEGNVALPPPRKIQDDRYLGVYDGEQLSKIPMNKLTTDSASYAKLIRAKKDHKNSVVVLYNFK